jgi:hypothetical protein
VPLRDVDAVRYRHEALRDLERPAVRAAVTAFADGMRTTRTQLERAEKLHHRLQRRRWFLDTALAYCAAVARLADDLAGLELASRGFRGLREHLRAHVAGDEFLALRREAESVLAGLDRIAYAVHVRGSRVRVTRYAGEPDYSAEIEAAFAKFRQGAAESHLVALPNPGELDHVEARVLEGVAQLHPAEFEALAGFCDRRSRFVDATLARFDREVQLYLAYLAHVDRLGAAGVSFCYPRVSARSKEIAARDTFDLALATKLVPERQPVVCNDLHLEGAERIFVVTGPNQGGKTTFARTFGQLHQLARLGLPVPGSEARLFLPDEIYTHFEREEELATLRGKLEDELVRIHEILGRATGSSVVVMNESFGSTTLRDALLIGTEVMRRLIDLDVLAVYVTFVDELSELDESTVSVTSTVVPGNPAQRTFRIVRRPADGLAYAWALADKYGLGYERLRGRLAG